MGSHVLAPAGLAGSRCRRTFGSQSACSAGSCSTSPPLSSRCSPGKKHVGEIMTDCIVRTGIGKKCEAWMEHKYTHIPYNHMHAFCSSSKFYLLGWRKVTAHRVPGRCDTEKQGLGEFSWALTSVESLHSVARSSFSTAS